MESFTASWPDSLSFFASASLLATLLLHAAEWLVLLAEGTCFPSFASRSPGLSLWGWLDHVSTPQLISVAHGQSVIVVQAWVTWLPIVEGALLAHPVGQGGQVHLPPAAPLEGSWNKGFALCQARVLSRRPERAGLPTSPFSSCSLLQASLPLRH